MEYMEYMLRDIARTTSSQIKKKYPEVELVESQASISEKVIHHETIAFDVYRPLTQEEGIQITKDIVDIYLKKVLSNNRMRVYLSQHPFSYKNLIIKLLIYTPEGKDVAHPDIAYFTLENGKFYFTTRNPSKRGFISRTELGYEDAISMIDQY